MLEMPPKCFFDHIIKKLDTSAFLEGKMVVRIKIAKKNGSARTTFFDLKRI